MTLQADGLAPGAFFLLVGLAGEAEEVAERLELGVGQMAELFLVAIADRVI